MVVRVGADEAGWGGRELCCAGIERVGGDAAEISGKMESMGASMKGCWCWEL